MLQIETKTLSPTDIPNLQGLIISGYGDLPFAGYLFLRIADAAQAQLWLQQALPFTTSAQRQKSISGKSQKEVAVLNLAFSARGLEKLGLPQFASEFPEEFVQGMANAPRARRLGDVGPDAPDQWEFGGSQSLEGNTSSAEIHVLVIIQTRYQSLLNAICERQRALAESSGLQLLGRIQYGYQASDAREHFGFVDGVSQPFIENSPAKPNDTQPHVRAGEFILGYHNESDILPASPAVPGCEAARRHLTPLGNDQFDFGQNGTFLVFRKLRQDVAAFRKWVHESADTPQARLHNSARVIGRWPDGAPLALAPNGEAVAQEDRNNFSYRAADPEGLACPLGAHIRRSNPRDSLGFEATESMRHVNRHRLLRRGARYGPALPADVMEEDRQDRGLFFVCLNADIARQFEFVQQTWIVNPKFNALYNDADPLLGPAGRDLTIQACPVRSRLKNLPSFVTMKGGGYFFLPSLPALRYLAAFKPAANIGKAE